MWFAANKTPFYIIRGRCAYIQFDIQGIQCAFFPE